MKFDIGSSSVSGSSSSTEGSVTPSWGSGFLSNSVFLILGRGFPDLKTKFNDLRLLYNCDVIPFGIVSSIFLTFWVWVSSNLSPKDISLSTDNLVNNELYTPCITDFLSKICDWLMPFKLNVNNLSIMLLFFDFRSNFFVPILVYLS